MKVLVVIFGGMDHELLDKWDCTNLKQAQWGKVTVDHLWQDRDVATQITAQLITGKTWEENGVNERKKSTIVYRNRNIQNLENRLLKKIRFGRGTRKNLYAALRWADIYSREFLKKDLRCPSLFDLVENSKAVYVPAYNPEPSWALGRNILNPHHYPDLGPEAAEDLLEKNYNWRRKKFMEALEEEPPYQLLVAQFQYIDSSQHLYLDYSEPERMDLVEQAYWKMDAFAGEILKKAESRYERVLFISDNGAARKRGFRPTHHNRPCYSVNSETKLDQTNIRDFFDHILTWTKEDSKKELPQLAAK